MVAGGLTRARYWVVVRSPSQTRTEGQAARLLRATFWAAAERGVVPTLSVAELVRHIRAGSLPYDAYTFTAVDNDAGAALRKASLSHCSRIPLKLERGGATDKNDPIPSTQTHTHRRTLTDTQAHRHTGTQAHRHTCTHVHRYTHTHTHIDATCLVGRHAAGWGGELPAVVLT